MTIPIIPSGFGQLFGNLAAGAGQVIEARTAKHDKDRTDARAEVERRTRLILSGAYPRSELQSPSFIALLHQAELPNFGAPEPSAAEIANRAQAGAMQADPSLATAGLREAGSRATVAGVEAGAAPRDVQQRQRAADLAETRSLQQIEDADYAQATRASADTVRAANTATAELTTRTAQAAFEVLNANSNVPFINLPASTVTGYHALGIPIASIYASIRSSQISSNAQTRVIDREYERAFQRNVSELMKMQGFGLAQPDAEAIVRGEADFSAVQSGTLRYTPRQTPEQRRRNIQPTPVSRHLQPAQVNAILLHQRLETYRALADMDASIARYSDAISRAPNRATRESLTSAMQQVVQLRESAGRQLGFGAGQAGGTAAPVSGERPEVGVGGGRPSDRAAAVAGAGAQPKTPEELILSTIMQFAPVDRDLGRNLAQIITRSGAQQALLGGNIVGAKAQMRSYIIQHAADEGGEPAAINQRKQQALSHVDEYINFLQSHADQRRPGGNR